MEYVDNDIANVSGEHGCSWPVADVSSELGRSWLGSEVSSEHGRPWSGNSCSGIGCSPASSLGDIGLCGNDKVAQGQGHGAQEGLLQEGLSKKLRCNAECLVTFLSAFFSHGVRIVVDDSPVVGNDDGTTTMWDHRLRCSRGWLSRSYSRQGLRIPSFAK